MMAEGDGEVKKEAVEAGAGGAGGRPTGARKPAGSPAGDPAGEEVAQQGPAAAEPRRKQCSAECIVRAKAAAPRSRPARTLLGRDSPAPNGAGAGCKSPPGI